MLARHFVALAACSCVAPPSGTPPRLSASQRSECTQHTYDGWRGLVVELAREVERTARAPTCREHVEAARASSSSLEFNSDSQASALEPCAALAASYQERCGQRNASTCAEQNCVDLSVSYHQRGCAGVEKSATWRASFDEAAEASVADEKPWQELRARAELYAECVQQQATNDPSWRSLRDYVRGVSRAASAETAVKVAWQDPHQLGVSARSTALPRSYLQCGCSLEDVSCGTRAWLVSIGCTPWDSKGRSLPLHAKGTCQCEAGNLLCGMQCAR